MEPRFGGHIIGREHPAALLRAEVTRLVDSHGGLVLVSGEPGIGKTTLVSAAADEARRGGALVLGAACWDSDTAPDYWPWVQVLRRLARSDGDPPGVREAAAAGLAALLGERAAGDARRGGPAPGGDAATEPGDMRAAGDVSEPGDVTEPGDAGRAEFDRHDAVTAALVAVAQHRPVAVVFDDLHWADPASLRLLQFVTQHAWFERLLLIGTYRDAEVESGEHPLRPWLLPLTAKATTVTLTGLGRAEVAALIARTAGREPAPSLVDEVHRRTGGNPFFVEQTARLWHTHGLTDTVAPGVREVVRRRLDQLPAPVVDALTVAAVLGREFDRGTLAACVPAPVAQIDRLLGRAAAARLVLPRSDGRFVFVHDLVRETLYDGLAEDERRARHAAVVRAVDRSDALAGPLSPAHLARHAWLAGAELEPERAGDLLLAAARDAGGRIAMDESVRHYRRALELTGEPGRRVRVLLELAGLLYHAGPPAEVERLLAEAAALARELPDPGVLTRVALIAHRQHSATRRRLDAAELVREAYRRLIAEPEPERPVRALVTDLITATETLARHGRDDEALTFSLWARHDTTWGLGTARERAVVTAEIREVARRSGDRETELWATALRWVALLELGDPGYRHELTAFVTGAQRGDVDRQRVAALSDSGIIAAFQGDLATAEACFAEAESYREPAHSDHAFMTHHMRWSVLLLYGRVTDAEAVLDRVGAGHPQAELLRALTAAERGDAATVLRLTAAIEAAGTAYPRSVSPLWLRLRAQAAAVDGDPARCAAVRSDLAPHRGQWTAALFGCDIGGPVDLWLAMVDAAEGRWDDAIDCYTAARAAADRLGARPWSVLARAGLVGALAGRDGPGDAAEARRLRAETVAEARALGMVQVVDRLGAADPAPAAASAVVAPVAARFGAGAPALAVASSAGRRTASGLSRAGVVHGRSPDPGAGGADVIRPEFRPDGPVWRLGYDGIVVHLPDAKGLHDLRLLLSRPGADVPAVELLDPAAGPELVAARRLGADPVLDDEAKARYRRHLRRLDDEIDRAAARDDERRLAELDAERAALLDQLRAAAGLAGRSRRLGDQAERARKAVTGRIRDTLRRIDERHPALAAHLRESVTTGGACRYRPAEPVPWRL
ncbi:AAA family ATPase [Micromonospora tulbaghiae]|uniref:AAA ATPase domain-containing protein n=1 Tax=Micromonospora tulbaghiae TaxID=479978 RepID=A0AAW4JHR6_9ACTN|nr:MULTISPECIES: AAA family ATPase [Micromonospora]KAB1906862.1 AAA family ATPase [Micromonospora sp. AMSO1212t]MBO4140900.1 AAA family ATPase [Micromonospora tulbaghiae]MDX5460556.1 AAA family ATPase [Micromonospora tulbaghiae]SCE81220.1 AAA ATPase domain-containing protein [Micromonospora tulbaghiae]